MRKAGKGFCRSIDGNVNIGDGVYISRFTRFQRKDATWQPQVTPTPANCCGWTILLTLTPFWFAKISRSMELVEISLRHWTAVFLARFIASWFFSSGKPTLLNCISTIDQASAGHIFIDDQELPSLRGAELSAFGHDRRLYFPGHKACLIVFIAEISFSLTLATSVQEEVLERGENVANCSDTGVLDKFLTDVRRQRPARLLQRHLWLILHWSGGTEPTGAAWLNSHAPQALESLIRNPVQPLLWSHDSCNYALIALFH